MGHLPLPETDGVAVPMLRVHAGRAIYLGPSLHLSAHTTSVHCLVLGIDGPFTLAVDGLPEVTARSALIPPRQRHKVTACDTTMMFAYLDATAARAREHSASMGTSHGQFRLDHLREDELIDLAARRRIDDIDTLLAGAEDSPSMDRRIQAAIDCLDDPVNDTSATAVAARVAMSPSHFLHTFASHTGTSFRRYKLWLRMLRVAAAIGTGASFTDAAMDAGFASPSHFSDAFHAMFGLTPTDLLATGVSLDLGTQNRADVTDT